jgi:hypothetical protein
MRQFILVFCAYTFILGHTLSGGLRRRSANKPLMGLRHFKASKGSENLSLAREGGR